LKNYKLLTIVTITYNNDSGLNNTYSSIKNLLEKGVKHIIINGGKSIEQSKFKFSLILNENDEGIYDALNKGVSKVNSKYFMLLHSGDIFVSDEIILLSIIKNLEENHLDLILNNQYIGFYKKFRKHRSDNWQPWMLNFGAQPAHLPTIYRTEFALNYEYKNNIEIVADFIYFENIFDSKPNWSSTSNFIVKMEPGGKTSSGLKSFFYVSNDFIKNKGLFTGIWLSIARLPFKIIQAI
tara:strand:+ start:138 stop:851 length:714 start_codon:yes stop_codon:yes gene_type:complete